MDTRYMIVLPIILSLIAIILLSESYFLIDLKDTNLENRYKDTNNNTYLYSTDTFLYYRLGRNLIDYEGSYSNNTIINPNNQIDHIDKLRYGTKGNGMSFQALPYILYLSYNSINFFSEIVSLEFLAFFLPVVLGVISINLFLLICYDIIKDRTIAFLTSLMLAVSYFFVSDNIGGYFDNQTLVFLVNMLAVFLFVKVIIDQKIIVRRIGLALLILLELNFIHIWKGLVYINLIFAVFIIISLFSNILKKNYKSFIPSKWVIYPAALQRRLIPIFGSQKSQERPAALLRLGFFTKWIVLILLILAFLYYFESNLANQIKDVFLSFAKLTSLSNQLSSERVIELQPIDLAMPNLYFNLIIILITIISLANIVYKLFIKSEISSEEVLILSWFIVIIVPAIISRRFVILALPAIYLLIGCLFQELNAKFSKKRIRLFKKPISIMQIACFIMILIIIISFLFTFNEVAKKKPVMNDAILETADFIKQNTSKDAIINVFWDEGYIWQAYADRATLTDGGLFILGENYWFNQALLADNEIESVSIIRTINCLIGKFTYGINNPAYHPKVRELVFRELIKKPKNDSLNLAEKLNLSKIINVNITHCENNPELLLIISQDTVLKAKPISERPLPEQISSTQYIDNNASIDAVSKTYNITIKEAEMIYDGLNAEKEKVKLSNIKFCDNIPPYHISCLKGNAVININTLEMTKDSKVLPNKIILFRNSFRNVREINNKEKNSLIIFNYEGSNYLSFVISDHLADSMLVRLFGGEKMNNFELLYQVNSPKRIMTYRVKNI